MSADSGCARMLASACSQVRIPICTSKPPAHPTDNLDRPRTAGPFLSCLNRRSVQNGWPAGSLPALQLDDVSVQLQIRRAGVCPTQRLRSWFQASRLARRTFSRWLSAAVSEHEASSGCLAFVQGAVCRAMTSQVCRRPAKEGILAHCRPVPAEACVSCVYETPAIYHAGSAWPSCLRSCACSHAGCREAAERALHAPGDCDWPVKRQMRVECRA